MSAYSIAVLRVNAEISVKTFRGVFLGSLHINTENLAIDVIKKIENRTGLPAQELRILYSGKYLSSDSSALREAAEDWLSKGERYSLPLRKAPDFYLFASKPRRSDTLGPVPLKFIFSHGKREGEVLTMAHATEATTMHEILEWMSSDVSNKEADVVSFFLKDFGMSENIPIHDKQPCCPGCVCGAIICDLNKDASKFRDLLDNPVYISMKKYGWNSGMDRAKKLTIELEVSWECPDCPLVKTVSLSSEYNSSSGDSRDSSSSEDNSSSGDSRRTDSKRTGDSTDSSSSEDNSSSGDSRRKDSKITGSSATSHESEFVHLVFSKINLRRNRRRNRGRKTPSGTKFLREASTSTRDHPSPEDSSSAGCGKCPDCPLVKTVSSSSEYNSSSGDSRDSSSSEDNSSSGDSRRTDSKRTGDSTDSSSSEDYISRGVRFVDLAETKDFSVYERGCRFGDVTSSKESERVTTTSSYSSLGEIRSLEERIEEKFVFEDDLTAFSVHGAEPSMTSQCWSSKAPKWRWAERGLSLEGRCTNFSCKAHGSMVIVNKRVNDFDLTLNYNDCHCPLCGRPVIPEKPGFNNCLWRIEAAKFDSRSRFCTSWTRTKDEYWTYDLAARGRAIFSRLQIFVRELTDAPRVSAPVANSCMICFKSMGREPQFQLSCMRIIHHVCSKKWAQVQRTMNCELPCPACEGPHLCADDTVEEIKATRIVDIGENAVGLRK